MINNEIIEYNTRQIKLMEKRVLLYKNNNIGIKKNIDVIDALTAWIQEKSETRDRELKGLLWEIKIIYAWSLAQQKKFSIQELQEIDEYIDKVKNLIDWYRQNCLPSRDVE